MSRVLTRAPMLLSQHFWIWPLVGAILISIMGIWTRALVESAVKEELAARLQTLLAADIAALKLWLSEQESNAKSYASDVRIQEAIVDLARSSQNADLSTTTLSNSDAARTLKLYLLPLIESQRYLDYVVIGMDRRILASPHAALIGRNMPPGYDSFVRRAMAGLAVVSRPFARELTISQRAAGPTMFVATPVKNTNGVIIAVLGLRMRPEEEFSQIFSVARMGESGEAYAFDRRGIMLTPSRFDIELKSLGLIPDVPEATAILNLRLSVHATNSAPAVAVGTNKTGHASATEVLAIHQRRLEESRTPLTRMAADAVKGSDGCDVDGYLNYRGIEVVGAWAWLPEFGLGVATEVGADEAFQTLYLVRRAFLTLFLLLVLSGAAIFAFSLLVERLKTTARRSVLAARRLGQYALVQEIGRGANGMVYRARHSLLRRPVAIKILSPDLTNDSTAERFEHEVQMTSQLTHPNTVAIYDYGRTPEGLFYYAMEYLSGIDLDRLVREFGPQPEGRVIHILRQVCGSLAEAHRLGLIHRDIKPANIVLTRRGGVCDLVKVLDFGLVKQANRTSTGLATEAVVGTPHFMPPEAIERPTAVDPRSDLYSAAAVGYWLLTGKTLFDGSNVDSLLSRQVKDAPLAPSERSGLQISPDLERAIMRCLSKNPDDRPGTAGTFDAELANCVSAGTWTTTEADKWWGMNVAKIETAPAVTMAEKTLVIAPRG